MGCGGRHTNYELIHVLLAILVICGLTILGPFTQRAFNSIIATFTLDEFETAFAALQHPDGTERLVLRKMAGNLAASDKGNDFFVGEVRRSTGDTQAIARAYANQTIPNAGDLHILFITDGVFPPNESSDLPETLNSPAEWGLTKDQTNQPLYLIYILVMDYQN